MRRSVRLKYLMANGRFKSGRTRYYYRRAGRRIPLPDFPADHPEFLAQYAAAAKQFDERPQPGPNHQTGTIGAGIRAFLASDHYLSRAASTRAVWRRMLEHLEADYGKAMMADLLPRHIRKDLAKLPPHPANNRLKVWRALGKWWVNSGLLDMDPARDVTARETPKTEGHAPWDRAEIEAFRARWGYDTPHRLAFELIFWTGARRSDVVRLGPGMVDAQGWLVYVQQKTGGRVEVPFTAPAPEWAEPDQHLANAIAAQRDRHMTWVVTRTGKARSSKAFGAWFATAARAAGIAGKTAHGLRKSRGIVMRENGATLDQRMAWLGHDSASEAHHYGRAADVRRIISGTESAHSSDISAQLPANIVIKQ
ncbi:tyrosine-type recombinase/integrase [Pontibaca salina]